MYLIPPLLHLMIMTVCCYCHYFIWQIWKEISFNGDLQRYPRPNMDIPSISWTVDLNQAQCNLGYIKDDLQQDNEDVDFSNHQIAYDEEMPTKKLSSPQDDLSCCKDNELLMKEFECPICLNLMIPPLKICQCSFGHLLCSTCSASGLKNCPICREKILGRAHNIENIAQLLFSHKKV